MTTADNQPHGERRCYLRGCRRDECATANYRYMSRFRLDKARGQRRQIDATQTIAHAERLTANGWTHAQIAEASGLGPRTIGELFGRALVHATTAKAILSVPIGPAPAPPRDVDATGTRRRIQALAAIGWEIRALAPHVGVTEFALRRIAADELKLVRASTADAVARMYRQLSRTPGNSVRARNLARKKGWHGPMAWDDIDDPNAVPEDLEPYQPPAANGRDSMRVAEIRHLLSLGESPASIARQMGGNEKYIRDLISQRGLGAAA
ncbi:hypothetical protein [Streptomyces formicae]|uniref:Uncharacterized protein n=1 Tax=Streptomyces formicae TaxID=1616117 RepID=A0ABY3WMF3_9ACTN|nr:hypothetical protein [Streptomyces formicae]UNM13814.1 hypothetical protein J4032_22230 [Streptomyces formicae]